jgi:hypothetical protein
MYRSPISMEVPPEKPLNYWEMPKVGAEINHENDI